MKWTQHPADVLPAWVADMDFAVAEPIRAALERMITDNDLGYALRDAPLRVANAFSQWMGARHGWTPDPANVLVCDDLVQMLHACVLMFAGAGEGVIVQTPIYPPFLAAVRQNQRRLIENRLAPGPHRWEIDFDRLLASIDGRTRLMMLCNPHNPTGRVFLRAELDKLARIACEHNLIVVADEIHMDLTYAPHKHIPLASLGADIAARTITLSSASKAFNIAGLHCAVAHFGSSELRGRFDHIQPRVLGGPSSLAIAGVEAAWREGTPWLDAVLLQLDANRHRVAEFIRSELPGITHQMPEATYLAWLDCGALNLPLPPAKFFLDRAKVALGAGADFSSHTEQFVRLNFATSPQILEKILARMARAIKG